MLSSGVYEKDERKTPLFVGEAHGKAQAFFSSLGQSLCSLVENTLLPDITLQASSKNDVY